MRILLFSGTGDGRLLSRRLREHGAEVTVCVATDYGRETQGESDGIRVLTGPLPREEKLLLLRDTDFCIDATHPYARHVSASVREACREAAVPYLRLLRRKSGTAYGHRVPDAEAAAAYLAERDGNVLLTTGAKELPAFSRLQAERIYPRILPTHEALLACEALGIPHRNIIAMQGPFSTELNAALLRQYDIRFLVSKDGGDTGGFPEKAEAAEQCGVDLIVLRRPEETGFSEEEILNILFKGERKP